MHDFILEAYFNQIGPRESSSLGTRLHVAFRIPPAVRFARYNHPDFLPRDPSNQVGGIECQWFSQRDIHRGDNHVGFESFFRTCAPEDDLGLVHQIIQDWHTWYVHTFKFNPDAIGPVIQIPNEQDEEWDFSLLRQKHEMLDELLVLQNREQLNKVLPLSPAVKSSFRL